MRILVTGAGGFIGKNLVERLSQSHVVISVVHTEKPDEIEFLESMSDEILIADVTKKSDLEGITEDIDIVYHLAAQKNGWSNSKEYSHKVNVEGTRNVLEECVRSDVNQFIHCSTSSIIGPVRDEALDENYQGRDTSKVYYQTKLEGEEVVKSYSDKINVTILSPTLVYGPHDDHHLKIFNTVKNKKIHFVGDADNKFQPTYISDCIDCFVKTMNNEKAYGEKYIIANDDIRTSSDFIYAIADALNIEISPIHVPLTIAKFGSYVLERLGDIFGFKPPLNKQVIDWFTENHFFDISKAKSDLDYNPKVGLEEGMEKTVKWYQENGWI